MSIKFNKHGLRVNNLTSDNIVSSDGSKFLSEKESDLKYISNQTVQNYNWTPDWRNTVRGVDVTSFETPVNGWLSINKSSSPIFINGKQITTLTNNGSYQSMLRAGDTVISETEFTYTFAPCKSEILDWREVPTDYDIWRGAIFRNNDGSVESRDLYIPDATRWGYKSNVTKVENNKAYNGEDFFCNIQTEKIEDAAFLFQLCNSITTFSSDLSSLTYGRYMFYKCTNLTSFNGDLSSLTNGSVMFSRCSNLTSFNGDLSSLTDGSSMFSSCTKLTTFTYDLPSLTDGGSMFSSCSNLTSFSSDLSSLTNGVRMFSGCKNLTSFSTDLPSLTESLGMFRDCTNLTSFNGDLPSLTDSWYMFGDCKNLTSFTSDLSSLRDGFAMFNNCTKLTSFNGDLPSLTDGNLMFYNCNLNQSSILNITNTIKDLGSDLGTIVIGNSSDVPVLVLNECGEIMYNKGWSVFFKTVYKARVDIVLENGYVPDASKWNLYVSQNLPKKVTKVSNGKMYVDTTPIGTIDSVNIINGNQLMYDNNLLTVWEETPLSYLNTGEHMFYECNFTTFTSDLSSLTVGEYMFGYCKNLTTFTPNLPSLTNGRYMFQECSKLTTFDIALPSLNNGYAMFKGCSSLVSFKSNLCSLTNGDYMFTGCKLDQLSVENIAFTINNYNGKLGLGVDTNILSNDKVKRDLGLIKSKGWNLTVNGSSSFEFILAKYAGCKNVNEVKTVDANYLTTDIIDGVWTEYLHDLTDGYKMFMGCTALTSFTSNLSSLSDGRYMFRECSELETFDSELSSLTNGRYMFYGCENLTSFTSDLSSSSDGYCMFYGCTNLITFSSNLSSLTNGYCMFHECSNLTSFSSSNLSSLTEGRSMFYRCTNLTSFNADLSNLTNGEYMFRECSKLETFDSNLSSLTNGWYMFRDCTALTSFNGDLSSLEDGEMMFYGCTNLITFSSNLPSLTNSDYMFRDCTALTSFNGDLSSIPSGYRMFYGCTNLTSFNSDLSGMGEGRYMFYKCKLDAPSVERILTSIPTFTSGIRILTLGIQSSAASKFKEITGYTPSSNEGSVSYKGWDILVKINA